MADREGSLQASKADGSLAVARAMHTDDLSSDDDAGEGEEGDRSNRNTIGRVPLHWYDEYDHIGYDNTGSKIAKRASGDGLDAALSARDDPNFTRTVYDAYNQRDIVLTDRELEIIRRIQGGAFPHPEFEAEADYVDYYTHERMVTSLHAGDEPKRRFVPSKWEMMKVNKLVQGIKEGRIVLDRKPEEKPEVYPMWRDDEADDELLDSRGRKGPMHIPAPKIALPGHAESYRPPPEYLLTPEEQKAWEEMDPEERPTSFLPKSCKSLREVGVFEGLVRERFERCLDLYLCPRALKRRLNIDPESLVPELPKPRDLRPFPNALALQYLGHSAAVRSVVVSEDGQWMASGDDDGLVMLWEVSTARRLRTWNLSGYGNGASGGGSGVARMEWNPNRQHHLLAVAVGKCVVLIATGTGSQDDTDITDALLAAAEAGGQVDPEKEGKAVQWEVAAEAKKKGKKRAAAAAARKVGPRVVLRCAGDVNWVAWHRKGDYLATVALNCGSRAVAIHQISKVGTQLPFRKAKGEVQAVSFHPSKPFFFVASKQHVRVYHLVQQKLVKKLLTGCKWISSIAVHPGGDHVIVGSYDRRVGWFDLDLSSTPYKTLKYHTKAVRAASFHRSYPLMASASDDGTVHVFHAMVYSDLLRNPLIVPLKILRGHAVSGGVGVLAMAFHPKQPWLFSAGADGTVRLFHDLG